MLSESRILSRMNKSQRVKSELNAKVQSVRRKIGIKQLCIPNLNMSKSLEVLPKEQPKKKVQKLFFNKTIDIDVSKIH